MAFPSQVVASQAHLLALLVHAGELRRPVGRRHALVEQLPGLDADHLAKSRVDISDAALQVAGAQAGQQRVFHCLAKRQRLAQVMLDLQAPAHVPAEQKKYRQQRQRQGADQRRQDIGKQRRGAQAAFHPDHHGAARQVQQLPGHKSPAGARRRAMQRQARAVGLGQGQADIFGQRLADQLAQQALQRIGGHRIAAQAAAVGKGKAHVNLFHAQPARLRQKVAH